jgi:hypothetical protein
MFIETCENGGTLSKSWSIGQCEIESKIIHGEYLTCTIHEPKMRRMALHKYDICDVLLFILLIKYHLYHGNFRHPCIFAIRITLLITIRKTITFIAQNNKNNRKQLHLVQVKFFKQWQKLC